jgi:hypothetical protein
MAIGYNLTHAQIAATGASPTYIDLAAAETLDLSISTNSDSLNADGKVYARAYGAPEGSGSIKFGKSDFAAFVIMNGGTSSTTGTTPNTVDKYVQPGTALQPPFILVGWVPNVDASDASITKNGFMVIVPACSAAPVSATFDQQAWAEWSADLSFVADDNNSMIEYQMFETAPTFTGEVLPVTI